MHTTKNLITFAARVAIRSPMADRMYIIYQKQVLEATDRRLTPISKAQNGIDNPGVPLADDGARLLRTPIDLTNEKERVWIFSGQTDSVLRLQEPSNRNAIWSRAQIRCARGGITFFTS